MKLGIGGRLGPLRAGVSNRGGGLGLGPIKATYGWVRGTDVSGSGMPMLAMAVRLVMISALIAWPYGLTTLAMRHVGFEDASAWNKAASWAAESVWLLLLLVGLLVLVFGVPGAGQRTTDEDGPL